MGKDKTGKIKRSLIDWEKLKKCNPDDIRVRYHKDSGIFELIFEGEIDR